MIEGIDINNHYVNTVVIDSCEYIVYFDKDNNKHITHKGNCKTCRSIAIEDRDTIINTAVKCYENIMSKI